MAPSTDEAISNIAVNVAVNHGIWKSIVVCGTPVPNLSANRIIVNDVVPSGTKSWRYRLSW